MENGKTILLVDDEQFVLDLYQHTLTQAGYKVVTGMDGEQGLSLANTEPDLILLDIMIPKIDGIEVLKKLKSSEKTKSIPVIMLTNLGQESIIKHAFELGAEGYLVKSHATPYEIVSNVKEFFVGGKPQVDPSKIDETLNQYGKINTMQPKILLIEDEDYIRDLYKRQLDNAGLTTDAFPNGQQGLAAIKQGHYDLVLLDIMLPDTNGLQILKEIKQNEATKLWPVVLLTNLGQDVIIKEGFELGAEGYLIKASLTPSQVVQEVKNILAKKQPQTPPSTPPPTTPPPTTPPTQG